ncbi:hypothetical protein ABFS82_02G114100 [Erythranthe guttata]|uniref:myosin heavy chain kinase C n=1 Tax=Erythranthe guttata TaxID=4155 RepID=UPI00064E1057|nr:PREDICTED: myosin heavy chain kinase C [Erythranthe guttata]|eukprot:XP_012836378.1 PREDICTED: myosin heavy chain kinase C [Erythranthe guttata]
MLRSINHPVRDATLSTPLLSAVSPPSTTTTSDSDESSSSADNSFRYDYHDLNFNTPPPPRPPPLPAAVFCSSYKSLAVLSGHVSSVSCLALCGEFILSASQGKDIIVWQQPDLRQFTKFGHGDGSVKSVVTAGNKVFTAHQDSRIRAWKVSRSSENVFKLIDTLPTKKDYLGKFMKQSNYVQTRRHHKLLWIEHADSISCLAVSNGLIYSGSWDKTLKVWRISDFKCLESIKAHDDAINGLAAINGIVYSASADGRIKAWGRRKTTDGGGDNKITHSLKGILQGHKDISINSVVVNQNGSLVYGGASDGYIMGWAADEGFESWKLVCEAKAHATAVLCVCLVGEFVCSGSADKSICVWRRDLIGGGLVRYMVVKGHEGPVKCLQASPERVGGGFMLYSGSLDKSIRVWWIPNHSVEDSAVSTEKRLKF